MASTSNIQLRWRNPSSATPNHAVPLEALPFPAALLDSRGAVISTNPEWLNLFPLAGPGANGLEWSEKLHASAADLHAALVAGLRAVLAGEQDRFTQEYGPTDQRHRLAITASGGGVLVLQEELACAANTAHPDRAQSQKMEAMGRLVSGVAHDFANLITLIAGYTDIVLKRLDERDPVRSEIEEIGKAANRGGRLTAQLLGFTRGQSVQPKPIDLNAILTDLQRMLRRLIGEYVQLDADLSVHLHRVLADPGQMEQVIMNLVLNARDAMPRGGRIRIQTANGEIDEIVAREFGIRPGPCVNMTISDTGHGIDGPALSHIFDPFFTTKEEGKGTGLGLCTVQNIVKDSGGAIWVKSAPGIGTTFTVCLPRVATSSEGAEMITPPRPAAEGSETILLVEDEEGVRRLLTHILRRRGYQVIEAASGEEALRIFERRGSDIHILLTDMVMPQMSGRELAEQVRTLSADMRVVFMSGYTDDILFRTGALRPGMSFLQKPLRPDVLAAKIREALDAPVK